MLKTFEAKIVYLFTILIFTNIIVYQYVMHMTSIQSNLFFVGLAMVVFVYRLLYSKISISLLLGRIGVWAFIYFIIITVYFILSGTGKVEFEYYKELVNSIIIILAYYWILSEKKEYIKVARVAILHATIITVILLVIDFFDPGVILDRNSSFFIAGRASGITLNPNTAGSILTLGLIFSIDMVPKKLRLFYMLLVFVGVLVTFSRSALLLYIILTIIFLFQKKISLFSLLVGVFSLSFLFGIMLAFALNFMKSHGIRTTNIEERIAYIESMGGSGNDDSANERILIVKAAYELFADNPFFGKGFAATALWHHKVEAHNQYMNYFAQYGILSLLIFPLLVYLSAKGARDEAKSVAIAFVIFMLIKGIFTHNILRSYYYLITFVLMMNMTMVSIKSIEEESSE